jgi:PBP1b-binding outer membrane lipoprotein LpoB
MSTQVDEIRTILNGIREKMKVQNVTVTKKIQLGTSSHELSMKLSLEDSSLEESCVAQAMAHLEIEMQLIQNALISGDISESEATDRVSAMKKSYSKIILSNLGRMK